VLSIPTQSQARPGLRPQAPPGLASTKSLRSYPLAERDSLLRRDRATRSRVSLAPCFHTHIALAVRRSCSQTRPRACLYTVYQHNQLARQLEIGLRPSRAGAVGRTGRANSAQRVARNCPEMPRREYDRRNALSDRGGASDRS
jgi:hypothetical protein